MESLKTMQARRSATAELPGASKRAKPLEKPGWDFGEAQVLLAGGTPGAQAGSRECVRVVSRHGLHLCRPRLGQFARPEV